MYVDWVMASSLATAGGTLVLAVATFASVRSANQAARTSERMLLAGLRPVLVPSRLEDPPEKIGFVDGKWFRPAGGHAVAEVADGAIYLAMPLRNVGTGLAVLHGWYLRPDRLLGSDAAHTELRLFHRLTRDLYVPAGYLGFWQGALRDPAEPGFPDAPRSTPKRRSVQHRPPLRRPRGRPADRQPLRADPPATTGLARRPVATGTSTAPTPDSARRPPPGELLTPPGGGLNG